VVSCWVVVAEVQGTLSTTSYKGVISDPDPVSVDLLFPGFLANLRATLRSGGWFADYRHRHPLLLCRHLLAEQAAVVHFNVT